MEPIKIQKVINYMEHHLDGEIDLSAITILVNASESDIQRSFKMITGLTIKEYIHNRRMTRAALTLKANEKRIMDIALDYGYKTAESFSKAFKQFHGCTPMEAKDPSRSIRYFNPIVIKLAKKGGNVIDYSECKRFHPVIEYYNASREHGRLTESQSSKLEFLVTMKYLHEVIPNGSRVLDCCAGTGIYAFELAKKCSVVAGDLVPQHLDMIRQLQQENPSLEQICELDVCRMKQFQRDSFDVVLCMGALYHLFSEEKRYQAVEECVRVCRPGGILVFTYLNRWGSFYNGLANNLKPLDLLYREFDSGVHEGVFYRTTPSEIDKMCDHYKLECMYHVGVDHLSYLSSERVDALEKTEYARLVEWQLKAAEDRTILGTSLHGLWIGRKT